MSNFPDRDYKYLPLYGDSSHGRRLFDNQRRVLESRGAFVRRVLADDSAKLDPVLRSHLGLEQPHTSIVATSTVDRCPSITMIPLSVTK